MRGKWGITTLHHNLEQDVRVWSRSAESFRRTLTYENDVTTVQMQELVARSKFCYQEITYVKRVLVWSKSMSKRTYLPRNKASRKSRAGGKNKITAK